MLLGPRLSSVGEGRSRYRRGKEKKECCGVELKLQVSVRTPTHVRVCVYLLCPLNGSRSSDTLILKAMISW